MDELDTPNFFDACFAIVEVTKYRGSGNVAEINVYTPDGKHSEYASFSNDASHEGWGKRSFYDILMLRGELLLDKEIIVNLNTGSVHVGPPSEAYESPDHKHRHVAGLQGNYTEIREYVMKKFEKIDALDDEAVSCLMLEDPDLPK